MPPANAPSAVPRTSRNPPIDFEVRLARPADYPDFKRILDAGKHPAFIGKDTMQRNARNGGALFYELDGRRVAVSLCNPHFGILLALNVLPELRARGLGASIIQFLMPNFVRAIESKLEWFKARGYVPVGELKRGISLNTQLMVRRILFDLAGNLHRAWSQNGKPASEHIPASRPNSQASRAIPARKPRTRHPKRQKRAQRDPAPGKNPVSTRPARKSAP